MITPTVIKFNLVRMDQLCREGRMGPAQAKRIIDRCLAIDPKQTRRMLKVLTR